MKPFARLLVATASVALVCGSNAGAQTLSDMELAQYLVKQREQLLKDKELKQKEQEKQQKEQDKQKQLDEKKRQEEKAEKERAQKEEKQQEQAEKKKESEKKEKEAAKSTVDPLPLAAAVGPEEPGAAPDDRLYACVGPNDVMHFLETKSSRSRAWNAAAVSRATEYSSRIVPRCSTTSRGV